MEQREGYNVFNYADKPDHDMNELVSRVSNVLNKHIPAIHFPYGLGMLGGYGFDALAFVTRRKFPISSVRVKKFCATTEFDASKAHSCGFRAPWSLTEGLERTLKFEFVSPPKDDIVFITE
jgi:nucleoside-diphosphate-sugar epimerase